MSDSTKDVLSPWPSILYHLMFEMNVAKLLSGLLEKKE